MFPRTWVNVTATLTIFAFVLLAVGVFSPFWIWLEANNAQVGVSLLYRYGCESESGIVCAKAPTSFADVIYIKDLTRDKVHWLALAGLEIGALVMAACLVLCFIIYACLFGSNRSLVGLNSFLTFVSILTWLPIGAGLIIFTIYHGDAFRNGPDISTQSFPWSAVLCFAAAILFVVVTILIRARCRKVDYTTHVIPASADSKMALYPLTKSALINRYFPPTAFREDRWQGHSNNSNYAYDQDDIPEDNGPESYRDPINDRRISRVDQLNQYTVHQQRELQLQEQHIQQELQQRLVLQQHQQQQQQQQQEQRQLQIQQQPFVISGDRTNTRVITEAVLDRGAGHDTNAEQNNGEYFMYTGKDDTRKTGVSREVTTATRGEYNRNNVITTSEFRSEARPTVLDELVISTVEDKTPKRANGVSHEFLYSAQHVTDRDASRDQKYMAHTDKPSEVAPQGKRLVLSPSNFKNGNVMFNQNFIYRPNSDHVY